MKTKMTKVTQDVAIWAIPRPTYWIEENPGKDPFRYKFMVNNNTPYEDGSVKVQSVETTLIVPAGIDLLEKAVDTLREEIKTTQQNAADRVDLLRKQIANLQLLEYQPLEGDELGDVIDTTGRPESV